MMDLGGCKKQVPHRAFGPVRNDIILIMISELIMLSDFCFLTSSFRIPYNVCSHGKLRTG
jgi:hypothetical protein